MSARNELAKIAAEHTCCSGYCAESQSTKTADAILAAGYTKHRTITTAEELDALANGATLKTLLRGKPVGRVWGKVEGTWWGLALEGPEYPILPAVVLHEPTA